MPRLQPELVDRIRAIRAGAPVHDIAERYVRRAQGRRVEAVAVFLGIGADAEPHPTEAIAKSRLRNVGGRAWWIDGGREPGQPLRNLRTEAIDSIAEGALRVARRGAKRCVKPDCCDGRGAKLANDAEGDHCSAHAALDGRLRYFVEVDRRFWRDLLPAVVHGQR